MRRPFLELLAFLVFAPSLAAQQPLPLRLDALVARTDSLVIRVNGQVVGWQRLVLEPTDSGFALSEETVTPGGGQRTRIALATDASPRSVAQQGLGRGVGVFTDITYAGGRVKGRHGVRTAAAAPIDTSDIELAVPAGVVDDNALSFLLTALPWAEGATWTFPLFSSGKREVSARTLRVMEAESVTVPAGTFETWRADMDAGDNIITFNVTRTQPHRLVQVRVSGMPIDFALAK